MSAAPPVPAAPVAPSVGRASLRPARWWRWVGTPLGGVLVLGAVLAAWMCTLDPQGRLGADTGGKIATLAEMEANHTWRPDVGYWAAALDPEAGLHPLHYTQVFGTTEAPRFVNVTTLPLVYIARPLFALGGVRLALLIPLLGALGAAAAARRLAEQLGLERPDRAFWLVGLAGPMAVYALDLWEHTLGVALLAWAVVAGGIAQAGEKASVVPERPVVMGLCLGAATVLRLESALYGSVLVATVLVVAAGDAARRCHPGALRRLAATLAASLGAMAAPLAANELLERAVLGAPLRSSRTVDTASRVGLDLGWRLREAVDSLFSVNLAPRSLDLLIGAGAAAALVVATLAPARRARQAAVGAAALLSVRIAAGFALITGLVGVAPATVAGAVGGWRTRPGRALAAVALLPVPAVWLTSYTGVSSAAWGPRYLLPSAVLLTVLGLRVLERGDAAVRAVVLATCLAVGAYGLATLAVRTHQGGATGARIDAIAPDTVVISTVPFLFREIGSRYRAPRRWLEANNRAGRTQAAAIARAVGSTEAALIEEPGKAVALPGWRRVGVSPLRYFGRDLHLVRLVPAGRGR